MSPQPDPSLEQILPEGQLVNRAWLRAQGFGRPRVDYFLRAGKLTAVARGIYRRPGPPLKWEHVVYSLNQMGCPVRVGGRSALELQGMAHYLPLDDVQRIDLYGSAKVPIMVTGFSEIISIYRSYPAAVRFVAPGGRAPAALRGLGLVHPVQPPRTGHAGTAGRSTR